MERQDQFEELRHQATEALELVKPPSDASDLVLQLVVCPTFDDYVSFSVYSQPDGSNLFVRQVIWHKTQDTERFSNPLVGLRKGWHTVPTMAIQDLLLDKEPVEDRVSQIRKMHIKLQPEHRGITLDGVRWQLRIPALFQDHVFVWNSEPQEWRDLIDWSHEMYAFLSDSFMNQ